jgi:flagellar biosynthesis component FlhA
MSAQTVLYVLAVILIALAALPLRPRGFSPALLGAAFALLAYAWPVITG